MNRRRGRSGVNYSSESSRSSGKLHSSYSVNTCGAEFNSVSAGEILLCHTMRLILMFMFAAPPSFQPTLPPVSLETLLPLTLGRLVPDVQTGAAT